MKHTALGFTTDPNLQHAIQTLLPDYEFTWNLDAVGVVKQAADLRPSFLLADVDDPTIEWRSIVTSLQSNPATRRIPMLGIAHEQTADSMRLAAAANINGAMGRDQLDKRLADWVARRARLWESDYYTALSTACQGELPELVRKGIAQFDAHDFWNAHETLEEAWIDVRPAPIGEVYRSILQVGVAYYQIQRNNYQGAMKMFLRSIQWLDPLPDVCHGIDIKQFKQDAAEARAALEALDNDRIAEFDPLYFKPVPFVDVE